MTKHCDTFEHTADVGLEAHADTQAELYEALAEGLANLVCPVDLVTPDRTFELDVESGDAELLAVDFLAKVLTLIHTERVCIRDVEVRCDRPTALRARLGAEPIDPGRHELGEEIKGVTYHGLEVSQHGSRWYARVLLDL